MSLNVVLYARVSTTIQDFERQIVDMQTYCKAYNYNIIEQFAEKESGTIKERPALTNMLYYAKSHSVDYIVVSEISRLGRTNEVLNTISMLNEHKIGIIFLKEGIRTLNEDKTENTNAHLLTNILSGVSSYELETIRYRVNSGRINSVKAGNWTNGSVPFGFQKEDNGKRKKLVICEKEAAVVRSIFDLYEKGYSCPLISVILNSDNIKTKFNNAWTDSSIRRLLSTTIYFGERHFKNNLFESPAIISKKQFLRVQTKLKSKRYFDIFNSKYEYLLNHRLIICGTCGLPYESIVTSRIKNFLTYMCQSKNRKISCGTGSINIYKLEFTVKYIYYTKLFHLVKFPKNSMIKDKQKDVNAYKIEKQKLENKKQNFLELFNNGLISKDNLGIRLKEINNTEHYFQKVIDNLSIYIQDVNTVNLTSKKMNFKKYQNHNKKIFNIMGKAEYLRKVINSIVIYNNDTIHVSKQDRGLKAIINVVNGKQYEIYLSQRSNYFIYNERLIKYDFNSNAIKLYPELLKFIVNPVVKNNKL